MSERPPQLSPLRLAAGLVLPLVAYLLIRTAIASTTGALAITDAIPATWLLVAAVARRRVNPIAVVSMVTVAIALAACALTGGDPLALKLRRGAVTGTLGITALGSVALGRPLLLLVAEHITKLNPERRLEIEARLGGPRPTAGGVDSHRDHRTHVHDRQRQPDHARVDRSDRDVRRRLDRGAYRRPWHRLHRHGLLLSLPEATAGERTRTSLKVRARQIAHDRVLGTLIRRRPPVSIGRLLGTRRDSPAGLPHRSRIRRKKRSGGVIAKPVNVGAADIATLGCLGRHTKDYLVSVVGVRARSLASIAGFWFR